MAKFRSRAVKCFFLLRTAYLRNWREFLASSSWWWLEGNEADKIDRDALAIVLNEEVAPESDLVYSGQFKKRLAGVALRRALEHAIKKPKTDIKGE